MPRRPRPGSGRGIGCRSRTPDRWEPNGPGSRPEGRKLISTVHHPEKGPGGMQPECHCVSEACGKTLAVGLSLVGPPGFESPDAGPRLQLGAWVLTGRAHSSGLHLTGIGGRADVHEEGSVVGHGETLRPLVGHHRKTAHQGIGSAGGR